LTLHDPAEMISLTSGNTCQLLLRNDFIPDYYLLAFPKDDAPRMRR
jgi:hypothetical protein